MPVNLSVPGNVGVISRSGTLTYEVVNELTRAGIGQSTIVGIGGDPIIGQTFVDVLERFEKDSQTKAVVLIGKSAATSKRRVHPILIFLLSHTSQASRRRLRSVWVMPVP